jgi:hypothetical protein
VWRYIFSSPSNKIFMDHRQKPHLASRRVTSASPRPARNSVKLELLLTERVVVDKDDELKVLVVEAPLFLRRQRDFSLRVWGNFNVVA